MKKETWKPILIPEVIGAYEVSSLGRVKSLPKKRWQNRNSIAPERIMKPTITVNGYLNVTLSKKPFNKSFYVHILIAMHFLPMYEELKFVNHKNGNKQDNSIENLEWCTRSQNMVHAFSNGLISKRRSRKEKAA